VIELAWAAVCCLAWVGGAVISWGVVHGGVLRNRRRD
jgi:hypothetical protein